MKITMKTTSRGFAKGEFLDTYGDACSIQESSVMREGNAIWLGCNKGTHVQSECLARMHLDRDTAKELIRLLRRFVKTGLLKK